MKTNNNEVVYITNNNNKVAEGGSTGDDIDNYIYNMISNACPGICDEERSVVSYDIWNEFYKAMH